MLNYQHNNISYEIIADSIHNEIMLCRFIGEKHQDGPGFSITMHIFNPDILNNNTIEIMLQDEQDFISKVSILDSNFQADS